MPYIVFEPAAYPQTQAPVPSKFVGITQEIPKENEFINFTAVSESVQLHCVDLKLKSDPRQNPSLRSRGVVNDIADLHDVIVVTTAAGERFLLDPIK